MVIELSGDCSAERLLRVLEAFENLWQDLSKRICGLDSKVNTMTDMLSSLQLDLSDLKSCRCNVKVQDEKGTVDRSFLGTAGNVNEYPAMVGSEYKFPLKEQNSCPETWLSSHDVVEENYLPTFSPYQPISQDHTHSTETQELNNDTQRKDSHQLICRTMSKDLSPEEASKRERLKRIHSRLVLLNPYQFTWAYVYNHLSSPILRKILWKDLLREIFGIQDGRPAEGIDGSTLVHPQSPFHQLFESLCVLILVLTVFIVPIELSFWSGRDPCDASDMLQFDMAADVFFLVDLVYRFFVGVEQAGGIYIDNKRKVRPTMTLRLARHGAARPSRRETRPGPPAGCPLLPDGHRRLLVQPLNQRPLRLARLGHNPRPLRRRRRRRRRPGRRRRHPGLQPQPGRGPRH